MTEERKQELEELVEKVLSLDEEQGEYVTKKINERVGSMIMDRIKQGVLENYGAMIL